MFRTLITISFLKNATVYKSLMRIGQPSIPSIMFCTGNTLVEGADVASTLTGLCDAFASL